MKRIYSSVDQEKQDGQSRWADLLDELREDFEFCNDPLYEQTSAGEQILELCYDVEREMNIYLEPSVQAGQGGIWIYDENDKVIADDIDYADFNNSVIDLAIESSCADEFAKKYRELLQDEIDFYTDTH